MNRHEIDNGGRLRLLFRAASFVGVPQTMDPVAPNFVTAHTSNPLAAVRLEYHPKGGRRPWLPALVCDIVHFADDGGALHRSSHWHIADTADSDRDRDPLDALYREFCGRQDVPVAPHVKDGAATSASADISVTTRDGRMMGDAWFGPMRAGRNAYWIRIVQSDGETAWNCPLYFDSRQ